ncbi:MAG TPA: VWA domain-containing protein [Terriglobales bacterium]
MRSILMPSLRLAFVLCVCSSGIYSAFAQNNANARPANGQATTQASAKPAAAPDKPADVSVNVNVVNALATVRDKHNKLVKNLSKDDFTLTDNGVPQTIHYFAQESDLPLSLGLLVDTSLSQRNVLDDERTASYKFLDQMLRVDKDVAFVIHFDHEIELLQDLTSSRAKLEDALHSLQIAQPSRDDNTGSNAPQGPGSGPDPRSGGQRMRRRGGTDLYDAIYLASNEVINKQQGRKALILLTDGDDRGSKETLVSAIEAAQRADTVVYSIYFKDPDAENFNRRFNRPHIGMGGGGGSPGGGRYPRGGPESEPRVDPKKILEQISKETGGRMFEVSSKDTVEQIYAEISDELRNQYNLGFTPSGDVGSAGYHKIQLATKKKDLIVQTRDGYYSDSQIAK